MSSSQFRRYTSLPFLLDILYKNRLPLLNPATWDDKNDSYFMELYKKKKKLKSLLAICFADSPESYHHWKIYAGDASGVCIEFFQPHLLNKLGHDNRFRIGPVRYPLIDNLERDVPAIDDLPFIKRYPFRDECEFRLIYEDFDKDVKVEYIPINTSDIERVVVNPWVNQAVFKSIQAVIKGIEGWRNVKVIQSTVVNNEKWKKIGNQAFKFSQTQLEFNEPI